MHELANVPYLSRFLFSALPHVAPYCAPGGIRVVSKDTGNQGSVRLEGGEGVVNGQPFLYRWGGWSRLAAVGTRFWSDKYPHLYDLTIQTDVHLRVNVAISAAP